MLESRIQSQIKADLTKSGWLVIKMIQTSVNGICDLLAVRAGRYVWIEVKSETGKVAPLQAYRHEELRRNGAEVIIARSTEDIKHLTAKNH